MLLEFQWKLNDEGDLSFNLFDFFAEWEIYSGLK